VTSDCFVDVDFNIEILSFILEIYDIDWYILFPVEKSKFINFDFSEIQNLEGIRIFKIISTYKSGDLRRLTMYIQLYKDIKNSTPDIIYINSPVSPYILLLVYMLEKRKIILTTHEGFIHSGFNNQKIRRIMRSMIFNHASFINLFSISQSKIFLEHNKSKTIYTIPLCLKSFGSVDLEKRNDTIVFLIFGNICYEKNIELLIKAACNIYEKGIRGFKISINGMCDNWDYYLKEIKYPQIFENDIRLIDNKEIPKLFSECHYLVQPYRIVSQSGPLKIAFNYNLPVICSNLPGFSDEVISNVNGFLFESCNVNSLEDVLIECIKKNPLDYIQLIEKMKIYTKKKYSNFSLSQMYLNMFNDLLKL